MRFPHGTNAPPPLAGEDGWGSLRRRDASGAVGRNRRRRFRRMQTWQIPQNGWAFGGIRFAGSALRSVSLEHVRVRVVLAGAALGEAELQGQAVARVGGAQRGFALDPAFLVAPEQALVERIHAFLQRLLPHRKSAGEGKAGYV